MNWVSDNDEATTATIGCVLDRSDDYYSEEETDWETENLESACKWMLNYSHSRNPPCAPARTHERAQAPREPPN
jgi:hypothetical protein